MYMKKTHSLVLGLMLSTFFSSHGQTTQRNSLKARGIAVESDAQAKRLWADQGVVQKLQTEVIPSGESIKPIEFLEAHSAAPLGTPTKEIVSNVRGLQGLKEMGISHEHGASPTVEELQASRHIASLNLVDRIADLLKPTIYLQNPPTGKFAPILKPTYPQMRATTHLTLFGIEPTDIQISAIAQLIGDDRDLGQKDTTEGLRLVARGHLLPSQDEIAEGRRQAKFGIGEPPIEAITEGLRQKKLGIKFPDQYQIIEGLRLAKDENMKDCTVDELEAALYLQNPGKVAIIRDPNRARVKAAQHLLMPRSKGGLELTKPDRDFIEATVVLQDTGGYNIPKPSISEVFGFRALVDLKNTIQSKERLRAAAFLADPDGLNETPKTLDRVDCVAYLQNVLNMSKPELPEIDAAEYLMNTRHGAALIAKPSIDEIRATDYLHKSVADGGLAIARPDVDDIKAVAYLQIKHTGLSAIKEKPDRADITAARYLIALPFGAFITSDLVATVHLQGGLKGLPVMLRPDKNDINAAKCLLVYDKPVYTTEDFSAVLYLQTNPGSHLGVGPVLFPEWKQIVATKHLQKKIKAGGLGIPMPSLPQVDGVAYLQSVLGLTNNVYLTPTQPQLDAIVHLQSDVVKRATPSDGEVRATALLQTPAAVYGAALGRVGPILDPAPSPQRIDATLLLQDWQYAPLGHPGSPARPTLPQIDAVVKGGDVLRAQKEIAWAIQMGFAGNAVGTVPVALGQFIEEKDGFHYFRLITIADTAAPPRVDLAPLAAAIEPVRDRLFNHVDGSFTLAGTTGFKVADANVLGLNRVSGDGKLPKGEYVVNMGLTPDLANAGAVIMTGAANHPN